MDPVNKRRTLIYFNRLDPSTNSWRCSPIRFETVKVLASCNGFVKRSTESSLPAKRILGRKAARSCILYA